MIKLKLTPGSLPADLSFWHPASLIATWFGSGLMPFASGSWGSLAALPFGWLVHSYCGWPGLVAAAAATFLAGWWASSVIVARGGVRDPGLIVIDEVAGQLLALALAPRTLACYALAFVLFRIADVVKPFPADWLDANIHGGLGVMLDDLVAGLYAAIAVWLLLQIGFVRDVVGSLGG